MPGLFPDQKSTIIYYYCLFAYNVLKLKNLAAHFGILKLDKKKKRYKNFTPNPRYAKLFCKIMFFLEIHELQSRLTFPNSHLKQFKYHAKG